MAKQRQSAGGTERSVRRELLLIFVPALAAVVLMVLFGTFTTLPLWLTGIGAIAVLAAVTSLLLIRQLRSNSARRGGEELNSVLSQVMLDGAKTQTSPMLICDEKEERIIWYNDALSDVCQSHSQLYGHKVNEYLSREASSLQEGETANSTIGDRMFRTEIYRFRAQEIGFCMLTLTEITEEERLRRKLADEDTVVAYILLDNLDDMSQHDQETFREVSVEISKVLREWADSVNGILKEYERDRSVFLFEAKELQEFIAQKFEILDRIRAIRAGTLRTPVTISIGVAAVSGTLGEKERAASAALETALQRGGDQVVVRTDHGNEYYGGRTKSVQKRTTVRARVIADELMMHMKRASNVVVMGHKYADFDSIGGCVGIARLAMNVGAKVNIVTDTTDVNLSLVRETLEKVPAYRGVLTDTRDSMDLVGARTLLVIVDVNNAAIFENPALAENVDDIVVIDHHRKTAELSKVPLTMYIEPSAAAVCELIAEMLEQVLPEGQLLPEEANIMLAGILVDTKQFTKNTGSRTFRSALYLRENGASPSETQNFFKTNLADFKREAHFRSRILIHRGVTAIAVCDEEGEAGDRITAAKAADKLLTVEGVQASFALVRIGDTIVVSARSAETLNVSVILEKLRGGGHFDAAGAQLTEVTMDEALVMLKTAISEYLDSEMKAK